MGITFAVGGSNLTVPDFEEKMFAILPQIYPKDFVEIFVYNFIRFLDYAFCKFFNIQFHIQNFYKVMNELDPEDT